MRIFINDKAIETQSHSVSELLQELKITSNVAIAINAQFAPKSSWHKSTLTQEDKIVILEPIQGG